MKTELPTKPGPYYWREKDGDEWEIAQINRCMDVYFVACDMHYKLRETGGEWLPIPTADELVELQACKKMVDEGQEAWGVFAPAGQCIEINTIANCEQQVTYLNETDMFLDGQEYTCRKVRVCKEVEG